MITKLSNAALAGIYLGVDRMRGFRAIAATVIARYCKEIAEGYNPDNESVEFYGKIITRWRLGDVYIGLLVSYRQDLTCEIR